ncbi:hypothetical protein [Archangium primigenium]|uniref:hypothetical protein n=1 Tax=[Archangium] primigenium TaxID=2792470 RepID=UPI0019575004|nr:hypothetical protein [Archangium primigenium]MBM7114915.1 hypothetical protein [Archangium primigenium]
MRTTLRAPVELFTLTVLAELALLESRPELGRVCRAALARDALDVRTLAEVLPGLSETACANLRRHCEYLGLCDEAGRLTALGRRCAEDSEVPVPEQGVYTFWVARHPLCGVRLLHVRREQVEPRDSDFQSLEPVPEWLRADRHHVWASVVEPGLRFCLRALLGPAGQPVRCRWASAPPCQVAWEVTFPSGDNRWRLSGQVAWSENGQPRRAPFTTPDATVPDLEARALLSAWEPRWDDARGFVAMDFDGHVDDAAPFLRSLRHPSVTVPGRGTYEKVELLEVPVGPSSAAQAQRWADALLLAALKKEAGYVPDSRRRALFAARVRDTPLALFPVAPAEPEAQLRSVASDERLFWMLAAPFDLRPRGGG